MAVNDDGGQLQSPTRDQKARTGSSGSEEGEPFAAVLEYDEAVAEIAGGNTVDAYLFRIVQSLVAGEEPNPTDIQCLLDSVGDDRRDSQ